MFKIQCVLAFATFFLGLAHSWDIAVTTKDKIELYGNSTLKYSKNVQIRDLTALSYDAVNNMLLFANKNNDNASIFSFYLTNKKQEALVRRVSYDNIHGLAFDPVEGLLFWADTHDSSIYWISMKPGSNNDQFGNLLFRMDSGIPRGIAVDSCRGFVYWTKIVFNNSTIERARFNGSDREVIVKDLHKPVSLAVDQQTKRIYWADDKEGIRYTIESADLDGGNRKILLDGEDHRPNALTVSKDSVYWLDLDYKTIWQLPKNASQNTAPIKYVEFSNEVPFGIAANYPVEEQIKGQYCEALENVSLNTTDHIIQPHNIIPNDHGLFCVHGKKVDNELICKCSPGYTGKRCDRSVCQNYCLQGNCSLTDEGQPTCSCEAGYLGIRCDAYVCHNYCLNKGSCSLNEIDKPMCQCMDDYEGSRCELLKIATTLTNTTPICDCLVTQNDTETSIVSNDTTNTSRIAKSVADSSTYTQIVDEVIPNCTNEWDSVRDPVIMTLGTLVGVLCLVCVVLLTKILQLKRRPRIKKRIIVNKNVTPLTARPDQCEITIENCCNMNICETPCFEPRSTIRPSLKEKPGKEEKKNLIANMEYPDDPY